MKKKNHVFKLIFKGAILCLCGTIVCLFTYYFSVTHSTELDTGKFKQASASNIKIMDTNSNEINLTNFSGTTQYIKYNLLNKHTIDAFISVEDKRFFEHNGVDYIRIIGAIKNNILNPSHKQGGSTITQQVIKNTQLSSEKTIDRKLKEIKLARELEELCSKEEILEMYLNSIYFGNGCYGIENASKYYFDKSANQLTIAESALLASTINAPSIYDPVGNPDKANSRKELVLKLMLNNKKISEQEYNDSIKQEISIEKAKNKYKNQYYKGVISEACKILRITENQLKNLDVSINTYYNQELQSNLENLINSNNYTAASNSKLGSIVLDNTNKSVIAFAGNSGLDLLNMYRQPGSTIKPILVYAPAFEKGEYSPSSFINDEPVSMGGYNPENASKTYSGMVTVKESLAKSLNIPAVKILDNIGISYSKNYAKKLGIKFDKQDNNLALALGGFTKGTTLKQLSDAYMCFANNGEYCSSAFIKSIVKNGETVYSRTTTTEPSVNSAVAYLINDCLKDTVKTGTAKRMNKLNFDLCAKTGTVGTNKGNTDAYNICYTREHTLCCWIGSNDSSSSMPLNVNGATYPTLFNTAVLQYLYSEHTPANFDIPNSISNLSLNDEALSEYKIEQDNVGATNGYFDNRYLPPKTSRSKLDIEITINNFENTKPIISFNANRDIIYEIYRKSNQKLQLLTEIKFTSGMVDYADESAQSGEIYEYYVISKNSNSSKESNKIKVLAN